MTVTVTHVRLCQSRMLFVRVYPHETQEMVLDARDPSFGCLPDPCTRGIYDSARTAVRRDADVEDLFSGFKTIAPSRQRLGLGGGHLR